MSFQTILLATLVVLYGAVQYTLMVEALRDLARRPRVRGDNKVVWGIVILTLPIAGALLYSWMGPTSLMRRGGTAAQPPVRSAPPINPIAPIAKVTPIRAARAARPRRADATRGPAGEDRGYQGRTAARPGAAVHEERRDSPRGDRAPRTGS